MIRRAAFWSPRERQARQVASDSLRYSRISPETGVVSSEYAKIDTVSDSRVRVIRGKDVIGNGKSRGNL